MPRTEVDHDDREPLYRQLAEIIRAQIESGEIPPRRAVPSKRMLRQRYEVSARTVDAAMAILRHEGLVEPERGKGVFVTEPASRRQA
ncbi:MAG TPA: winged helix-turn-helix domain-containing protein [Streptosporangiaceae bacterium]|jgi:GntR family transcriptional regulator